MPDNTDSSIIKIETLEKEYMVILKQYEENYNNYITNLKISKENTPEFVILQGRTYWGSGDLKLSTKQTVEECKSMCASDTKCTGATFNSGTRICSTRIGEGTLTSGKTDDYAILPKIRQNLIILKSLNQRLIDINNQINIEISRIYPIAEENIQLKNKKQTQLEKSYQNLVNQQIELEQTLNEYETIDQQYNNNFLNTVSQNARLRLWTIISLIVLFFTIKQVAGITSILSLTIFWTIIFILFLFLTLNLTTPQGFSLWSILIIIVVLIKLNILPSP
jgi:hypothetical protein